MSRQPYADELGGIMAVKPQAMDHESYDPKTAPYDIQSAPPTPTLSPR